MKCIKMIGNKRFIIGLYETKSSKYRIVVEKQEVKQDSELINDYAMASFLFDMKLRELEGQ